ncbi:MAG: Gfo/Idh/MocA family oxidoreductase, partial [Armatimonadota bacterium]
MEPVRIGIIGQGVIGHHHLEAALSCEYTELVAVADFYPERMEDARQAGVEKTYTSGRELIDNDDEVEAVILAMPSGVRTSLAFRALANGKHVLVEKPVANNAREVEDLIERRGDLVVGNCSLRHRLSDSAQAAQEFVETGALGNIRRIHVRCFRAAGPKSEGAPPPWRQSFSLNGGGVLTNWSCYDLDYVLGIAGWEFRPRQVVAQWWPCLEKFSHFVAEDSDADSHFAAFVMGEDDSVLTIERGEFMPIQEENAWQIIG